MAPYRYSRSRCYPYLLSNSTEGEYARANYLRDSARMSIAPKRLNPEPQNQDQWEKWRSCIASGDHRFVKKRTTTITINASTTNSMIVFNPVVISVSPGQPEFYSDIRPHIWPRLRSQWLCGKRVRCAGTHTFPRLTHLHFERWGMIRRLTGQGCDSPIDKCPPVRHRAEGPVEGSSLRRDPAAPYSRSISSSL
jgi:hypothetical protein